MNNLKDKLSQNENAAVEAAKKEPPFDIGSLVSEIMPLLEDYFVGELEARGGKININFYNGQKFKLSVEEV